MDAKVEQRTDADLGGAPEGLDALVVAERIKAGGGVGVFVARDYQRSGGFVQAFRFFSQEIEVLEYPAWDCLPYDRLSPTAGIAEPGYGRRIEDEERTVSLSGGAIGHLATAHACGRSPGRADRAQVHGAS